MDQMANEPDRDYVPLSSVFGGGDEPLVLAPSLADDRWSWIIALTPLAQVGVDLGVASTSGPTWATIVAVGAVSSVLCLLLADRDVATLRKRGLTAVPPYWVLLAPAIYLGLQGNLRFRRFSKGLGPFWTHLAVLVGLLFILVLVTLWGGAFRELIAVSL